VNITNTVIKLLGITADPRILGRIASTTAVAMWCEECGAPDAVEVETVTDLRRGAERTSEILCIDCAPYGINHLTWGDCDEIVITVPAHLVDLPDAA